MGYDAVISLAARAIRPIAALPAPIAPQIADGTPPPAAEVLQSPLIRRGTPFPAVAPTPAALQLREPIPARRGLACAMTYRPESSGKPAPPLHWDAAKPLCGLGVRRVYRVDLTATGIDVGSYLPHGLQPFPHAHPDLKTWCKRFIARSNFVARVMHQGIAARFVPAGDGNEMDVAALLQTNRIYNLVITREYLFLVPVSNKVSGKHLFSSDYAEALFAGEMSRDALQRIHFNPRSGTYMPSPTTQDMAGRLLHALFPHLFVISHTFKERVTD